MWSKKPFSRSRLSVVNPTSIIPEDTSQPYTQMDRQILPVIPDSVHDPSLQLSTPWHDAKRFSAVSAMSESVYSDHLDNGSFCVSPIAEDDRFDDKNTPYQSSVAISEQPVDEFKHSQETPKASDKFERFAGSHQLQRPNIPVPTTSTKTAPPKTEGFHMPTMSHKSSFLHWGRDQIQSRKARTRTNSSGANEFLAPKEIIEDMRGRSLAEHLNNRAASDGSSRAFDGGLSYTSGVVTTIAGGGRKPLPHTVGSRTRHTEFIYRSPPARSTTEDFSRTQPVRSYSKFYRSPPANSSTNEVNVTQPIQSEPRHTSRSPPARSSTAQGYYRNELPLPPDSKFDDVITSMMLPETQMNRPATTSGIIESPVQPQFDSVFDKQSEPDVDRCTTMTSNWTYLDFDSPMGSLINSPRESLVHTDSPTQSTDDLTSIMSRRRPISNAVALSTKPISKKLMRKPTPLEVSNQATSTTEPLDPESKILALEKKREALAKRRVNVETMIEELNKTIQPASMTCDFSAKAEVQKSIHSMENDVAEIKKEEHELGMKVARAWRRLDEQQNNGDGSNLWVKRVTS